VCLCGLAACALPNGLLCVLRACVAPQVFEYVERTILEDLEKSPDGLTLEEIRKCIFQLVKSIQVRDSRLFVAWYPRKPTGLHHAVEAWAP
jgi:hypothetical protein